jgi:choline kinase
MSSRSLGEEGPSRTAVILAAGRGRRLAPLTDGCPKCLLPIGHTSVLAFQLESLARLGVERVVLVLGHARERIEEFLRAASLPFRVETVFNPRFDGTNNLVSISLAEPRCQDGFVLLNSDVLCAPQILERIVRGTAGCVLAVDPMRPPRDEAMKVQFARGRLAAIGKDLDPHRSDGEYLGIARLDAEGAREFFRCARHLLLQGREDAWYEAAFGLAAATVPFGMEPTGGLPWVEIDDPIDLERARILIRKIDAAGAHGGSRAEGIEGTVEPGKKR